MLLTIKYHSCWRAIMLEGDLGPSWFNKKRRVIRKGSLGAEVPYSPSVTNNTALGIVYRLVGEQRRLWRVLELGDYLGIRDKIRHKIEDDFISREAVALREIGDASNPMGWKGIAHQEHNNFLTDPKISGILLFPLVCKPNELYNLIVNKKFGNTSTKISMRLDLLDMIQEINEDSINQLDSSQIKQISKEISTKYPAKKGSKNKVTYSAFCLSAMHMCANHIKNTLGIVEDTSKSPTWDKGISGSGTICPREMFGAATSGCNTVITFPMDDNWRRKTKKIEKPTGTLYISIDVCETEALKIQKLIKAANVGSFVVGKKGTAHLAKIEI